MSGRVLIAGTHSSVGKTTVTVGLLAALARRGVRVAPFKAGPDYIDPGLHAQAAGRPSRNLDVWLLDDAALQAVLRRGLRRADVAVIEGVMGLFDGIGASQEGSTAMLARTLQCPVILVLDVAAMSGTAAALVLGCQQMQPSVQLAGVVLNRVGSDGHAQSTGAAITATTGLPIVGSLPADPELAVPERHLGLVPAAEGGISPGAVERLAQLVEQRFDLAGIQRIADGAPALREHPGGRHEGAQQRAPGGQHESRQERARIAVAQDRAFGFYYQDTIDLLAECGAEIVPFSPLADAALPSASDAVYLGGGFPELYAQQLADNTPIRDALRAHEGPIYAECGGLMALGQSLTSIEGTTLPMFGLLPLESRMDQATLTIGYREVEAVRSNVLMSEGTRVRGHEFHWSVAQPPPADMAAYKIVGDSGLEGFVRGSVLGSYVHLNFAGAPRLAQRFVELSAAARDRRR